MAERAISDLRFLTERGWKHVTGAMAGRDRRPHPTTSDELLGFGRTTSAIEACADYRRGYLTGMVRGDGHLKVYRYERAGRTHGDLHRFRLAPADLEALDRAGPSVAGGGAHGPLRSPEPARFGIERAAGPARAADDLPSAGQPARWCSRFTARAARTTPRADTGGAPAARAS